MAPPFPHVNKLVTPAMYEIQRTKFLIEVEARRVDIAGLMPFDNLADSPVYNSSADFVTQIVSNINPHARYASSAMILLVHTLTQLGGNRWAELCVASRSFMQFRTPAVTARTIIMGRRLAVNCKACFDYANKMYGDMLQGEPFVNSDKRKADAAVDDSAPLKKRVRPTL